MTNETTKSETQESASSNKSVFGPLGKYAVVAVIMVSIIVTTAIMLDKQLNSVNQHIAEIESDVATMPAFASATEVTPVATETEVAVVETPQVEPVEAVVAETAQETATTKIITAEVAAVEVAITEKEIAVVTEATTEQPAATVTTVTVVNNGKDQARERQTRIEAYKLEQKQRTAEMFARIKALESGYLDKYKETQDKQIARLRDQITNQQAMIDALIVRNKNLFEIRAANTQRNQSQREAILNRI